MPTRSCQRSTCMSTWILRSAATGLTMMCGLTSLGLPKGGRQRSMAWALARRRRSWSVTRRAMSGRAWTGGHMSWPWRRAPTTWIPCAKRGLTWCCPIFGTPRRSCGRLRSSAARSRRMRRRVDGGGALLPEARFFDGGRNLPDPLEALDVHVEEVPALDPSEMQDRRPVPVHAVDVLVDQHFLVVDE